jgi:HNH endonuclease
MKGQRIKYSKVELDWVRKHSHLSRRDIAERFADEFGRRDVSEDNIKALCSRKGWSAGSAGKRRNAGKSQLFDATEVAWLKENAALSRKDAHSAFQDKFSRPEITVAQIVAFKKRNGIKTGRTGHFEKGHVPWTKGRKIGSHPNSAKTQFKQGATPANILPLWSERTRDDGYIEMKVPEPNPYTNAKTRFTMKHVYLWEKENGPVPDGHALKCLDGDKTNTTPSNWECVPRGLLPRLNNRWGRDYENAEPEVRPTIMAVAKLEHTISETKKNN